MRLERISLKTLRQQVYDQLRRRIISAEILPGESIHIRDLARELGVSTMPVREALWQLESERVIVIESNRRIHVNTLTPKEMEEALRIRLLLETLAAERSCERRSESVVQKVKGLLDDMEASVANPKKYMMKNSQFHFAVYSCADSPLLLSFIDWLWARVGPYLWIQATKVDLSEDWKYHDAIYRAFAEKDKERLREALRKDLEEAAKLIIPLLEEPASQVEAL
jgi:DNA-binding GntR family transcriptional regulator